jgi:hypothetical protein
VYLRIRRSDSTIELANDPSRFDEFSLTSMRLLKPFRHVYAASGDGVDALVKSMPASFSVRDFVDRPESLDEYGLDPPVADIEIRDGTNGLRLLAGKPAGADAVFAKLADAPAVFTIGKSDIDFALKADAFKLVNRLPLLVRIDDVDRLSFRVGDRAYLCELLRKELPRAKDAKAGDKPEYGTTYVVNGKAIEEGAFKRIYQAIIGIALEGVNPGVLATRNLKIEAQVVFWRSGGRPPRRFDFVSANSDFFALSLEGDAEFLVTKSRMREAANRVGAELEASAP